ncbi:hypothetical protein N7532_007854 [Penicillium argentinense]|uniref:Uncharacterized protein n=1 Tax=Penicillium argentinense TaxID=1131581 RepID=A0A9W9EWI7_9EURO|nr:uncharacterized protein N7532_007854 [Penicillium argentinense]KAJ5089170.1 hypothetical protein N7532_007854 [Penicillium argentinense]
MHRRAAFNFDASYSDYGSFFSDYSTADFDSASTANAQPTLASATAIPAPATTTPATLTGSPTSSPTSVTSTASAHTTAMTGSASSGLSTGAKAGIGVAIPVAAIILGLFVFWYLRKQRTKERNSASWVDNSSNTPELSENKNTVRSLPASQTHIAEADSNTIHESGGKSVVPSKSPTAGMQSPTVYELSGNSVIEYPPPVTGSSFIQSDSMDKRVHPLVGGRISQKADISSSSTSATETKESGSSLHISLGDFIDTSISPQRLQEGSMEITQRLPTSLESADMPLSQLEAEVALIAEEKERLQQLQSLAEREAELRRQILARKSAM